MSLEWKVKYYEDNKLFYYTITVLKDSPKKVQVTKPIEISGGKSGVELHISELNTFRSLTGETPIQELSEIFALYLINYPEANIIYDGNKIDPTKMILGRKAIKLETIVDNENKYEFVLEIIEWKNNTQRFFYFCSEDGFPFTKIHPKVHTPGFQYSAYLKSHYITKLAQNGILDIAEMTEPLQIVMESAQEQIKKYFRKKETESAKSEIDKWKKELIYPYIEEPKSSVENAERQVFDIIALNINRHLPDFASSDRKSKAFQFRILKQAIERGPEELQHIITEVLELPKAKQEELSKILKDIPLSSFISASKIIADRFKFLSGLETLIFDQDVQKKVKERNQLHGILAENTWIFGEEFNLTVNERSLTEVLRKHSKISGLNIVIDRPVKKSEGKSGRVDLMLSRAVPRNHHHEREHLIIELKAPKVIIGAKEITQIQEYAFAVAGDSRFKSIDTVWNFWLISTDMNDYAQTSARQQNRPRGLVSEPGDGKIKVWVKTWSDILAECRSRLNFVKDELECNFDKETSLKYLQGIYDRYLSGLANGDSDYKPEMDTEKSGVSATF